MDSANITDIFSRLSADGLIKESEILKTTDGFFLVYTSLSDILEQRGIVDFPDADGKRFLCNRFFDDWFLYAVADEKDKIYSLLKLREQEHDAKGDLPADGDTPGVTISFIAFDCEILLECLKDPDDNNRQRLDAEINRVVSRRGQRHDKALKKYFSDPRSQGAYLVAELYVRHIALFAEDGCIDTPIAFRETVKKSELDKGSAKLSRIPQFLRELNRKAGYMVCDDLKIYIKNKKSPTEYERAAVLSTHTGNTSVYSFAAEVEYHARFLMPVAKIRLPFLGKSIYESAIRADMTIGDTEFQGPCPFYRTDSKSVKRQYALHKDESFEKYISDLLGAGEL